MPTRLGDRPLGASLLRLVRVDGCQQGRGQWQTTNADNGAPERKNIKKSEKRYQKERHKTTTCARASSSVPCERNSLGEGGHVGLGYIKLL